MLEDVDCFESEQDVVENVGIFLADCCHAKQVIMSTATSTLVYVGDKFEILVTDPHHKTVTTILYHQHDRSPSRLMDS